MDTQKLRYANGTRPVRGKAMAIAEWPTANGPADYALFVGTTGVALVEAKRKRKNISAAIDQTGRYSQGFKLTALLPVQAKLACHRQGEAVAVKTAVAGRERRYQTVKRIP